MVEATFETASGYQHHAGQKALSGPMMAKLVRDVLSRGVPFRFQAGGSSMFPFIRDGDVISIVPLPPSGPGVGDAVAFLKPQVERLVVHRLVKKCDDGYILKGDNYRFGEWDGPIPLTNLLGIVTQVERKGKQVRLGLGPERRVIAAASRCGVLFPLVQIAAALIHLLKKYVSIAFFLS